jgi:hypothetical protein
LRADDDRSSYFAQKSAPFTGTPVASL